MHFGENQLSPSLIGLSPLPTAHPLRFQPKWVRSSTRSYPRFNLAMGRSLGFGSRSRDCNALLGLAFATAPPPGLTSPRNTNSQAHSSKGTPSPRRAPTACRRTVSGTLSLPSRGTFHLSLTVLVRYRSPGSIQAWGVVPPDSHGISRAPCYLGAVPGRCGRFRLRGSHPLRRAVPHASTNPTLCHCPLPRRREHTQTHDPGRATPAGCHARPV